MPRRKAGQKLHMLHVRAARYLRTLETPELRILSAATTDRTNRTIEFRQITPNQWEREFQEQRERLQTPWTRIIQLYNGEENANG